MDRTAPLGPVHRSLRAGAAGRPRTGVAPVTAPAVCAAAPTAGRRLWIQWTLSDRGHLSVVSFAGEIDGRNASDLAASLRDVVEAGSRQLIVDLTAVDFLGGVGSSGLLAAGRCAAARHLRLDVVCAATTEGKARVMAELGDALAVHPTVDDALRWQAGPARMAAHARA